MKRFALLVLVLIVGAPVTALAAKTRTGCAIVANPTRQHHTTCSGVSQWWVDLPYADLRYADLRLVNGSGDNLSHANFSNAKLHMVDLRDANLRHANLSNASLTFVSLSGADLTGANLHGATFCNVFMPDGSVKNPSPSCPGRSR